MVEIEDVVKAVVYRSREEGNPVTEVLAGYVVHTMLNPDSNTFFVDSGFKSDAEGRRLIELSVNRLKAREDPALETLKLQAAYDSSFLHQEYLKQQFISIQSQETNGLIDEIVNCETRGGNDFEGITVLYKRIFNFLLFRNKQVNLNFAASMIRPGGGLASISKITESILRPQMTSSVINTLEREVAAALESVLPRAGLRPFIALSTPEKVSQLLELSNIVIGIRLFNKEIGKGGVGLDSFEMLLNGPSKDLLQSTTSELTETYDLCEAYARFLAANHMHGSVSSQELATWTGELVHLRQLLVYLSSLQEDIIASENNVNTIHSRYLREMVELKELIGNKTSIPKDQVYPKFDSLSQLYSHMNEERNIGLLRKELLRVLCEHKAKVPISLPKSLLSLREDEERPVLDPARVPQSSEITLLTPENTADFMQLPLDYHGFCVWSLVEADGLLIPGKPSLGVVKYHEKHLVFTSADALIAFVDAPNRYLSAISTLAKRRPELIHFLRMNDEFPNCSLTRLLQGKEGTPLFSLTTPLMVDQASDTPLHFIEKNIVPEYNWNEWDLRRQAIQKANIRNRQTTAAQTMLSNFRRENESQVYLPKDQTSQTGLSKGTQIGFEPTYHTNFRNASV
jgi:hypothetical protein